MNDNYDLVGPEALYVTLASKMIKDPDFYRDLADARMTRNIIRQTAEDSNIDLGDNLDAIAEEVSHFMESSNGHKHLSTGINFLVGSGPEPMVA